MLSYNTLIREKKYSESDDLLEGTYHSELNTISFDEDSMLYRIVNDKSDGINSEELAISLKLELNYKNK